MSFKEKTISVTLVNFTLIMGFFLIRVFDMLQNDSFNRDNVLQLWFIIIFLATVVSVLAIILTIVMPPILQAIRTGEKEVDIDDVEDERDKLIDLKGSKFTQVSASLGTLVAMLTFAGGQSPLVMFTLLIFFGILSQIVGDLVRVLAYRGRI